MLQAYPRFNFKLQLPIPLDIAYVGIHSDLIKELIEEV